MKQKLQAAGMVFPYSGTQGTSKRSQGESTTTFDGTQIVATYHTDKDETFLRPFTLSIPQVEGKAISKTRSRNTKAIVVQGLIDTGAVHSSYISTAFADRLDSLNFVKKRTSNKRVCTGLTDATCTKVSHAYDIDFEFVNERTNKTEIIPIHAEVINCRYDLIIGRPDIFLVDLCHKFPSLFSKSWSESKDLESEANTSPITKNMFGAVCSECTHVRAAANPTHSEPLVERLVVSKDALLDPIEPDWDGIVDRDCPWDSGPSQTSEMNDNPDAIPPENFHGSEDLKQRLRELTEAYSDIFKATLTSEPARVPCFELKLKPEAYQEWLQTAAVRSPRPMSKEKQEETKRQIESMLELELISPTTHVSACSHVMLAPKPGGKWRFCVDYRTLNSLSESLSWPIPNIKEMLERIGTRRAKYFAVLDLSQGFYQVPLDQRSKALTAFTTWVGTFQWNRLPMGIKGAPPYFQYVMATQVLSGLNHEICELYIDDICAFASTEDEFIENLRKIFQRCRDYNIKLNPRKCRFGMPEVEYVGHTINETGLHFTRSKLDSVLGFELPKYGKQLKSFVGFCNYFRSHVKDFSTMMHPLNQLLTDYDKRRRLVWTEETIQAFEDMKSAIHECPSLFFIDYNLPIFLHTDASKYGI